MTFLAPMSHPTYRLFHADRASIVFGQVSGLMVFQPLGIESLGVVFPAGTRTVQLFEVVIYGSTRIDIGHRGLIYSKDLVRVGQVRKGEVWWTS